MNTKSFTLILLLFCLFFNSCAIIKTNRLVKNSELQNREFYVEIPFDYNANEIFIPVEIEEKSYNFILDTGADLSIIDNEILESISYQKQFSRNVYDASNSKSKLDFITIPKVSISELEFTDILAVSADLKHFEKRISCPRIDGIIGIDLMRKSNWKLDYGKEMLYASSDFKKLADSVDYATVKLKTSKSGAIITKLKVGGMSTKIKLDTGFSGGLLVDKDKIKILYESLPDTQKTFTMAEVGTTLNKKKMAKARVEFIKLNQIELQNSILPNQIITLSKSKNLIGNSFLKNYQVLMNFEDHEIYLKSVTKEIEMHKENFEIILAPNYFTSKIEIIGFMGGENSIDVEALKNLEIISLNNKDVSNFNKLELCEYWNKNDNPYFSANELLMKVKNGNTTSEIKLSKNTYL